MTSHDLLARLADHGLTAQESPGHDLPWRVGGNTYAHRDAIKRCGGRWSKTEAAWRFADAAAVAALAETIGAPPGLAEGAPAFAPAASPAVPAPAASVLAGAEAKPAWGSKHYHGHRDRLRDRFLEGGTAALADYELLELLLFAGVRYRDTKPIAKDLLQRFESLGGVLAADPARYKESIVPAAPKSDEDAKRYAQDLRHTQVLLKATHDLMQRVLKEAIKAREVVSSWTALVEYLKLAMQHEPSEHFRILFLDRKNILIKDEVQSRGTVDHTPLYPREVVKRALELAASAIIMVHNHPSGDPTPSKADVEMTGAVVEALRAVNITVHDHVIVGKNGHLSFKSKGLLG